VGSVKKFSELSAKCYVTDRVQNFDMRDKEEQGSGCTSEAMSKKKLFNCSQSEGRS
jgi:hypothetical protein